MARKRRKHTERQEPLSRGETWEVGLCRLTTTATDAAGATQSPAFYVAVQTGETSGIVYADVLSDGAASRSLADFVQQAIRQPLLGAPRRPERIRVGSQAEAESLAASLARTGIAIEVTAQLSGLAQVHEQLERMLGGVTADYRTHATQAGATLSADALREFFQVARTFYRKEIWSSYSDEAVFELTFEPAQGETRTLYGILMGNMGEEFGLVLFFSQDDMQQFYELSTEHLDELDELPDDPEAFDLEQWQEQADIASQLLSVPSLSLSYTPQRDVFPALVQEAQELKLPLAKKAAFPLVMRTGEGQMQVATAAELREMFTAMRAILDWDTQLDKLEPEDEFDLRLTSHLQAVAGFTPALTVHTTLRHNALAEDEEAEFDEEFMTDMNNLFESVLQNMPDLLAQSPGKRSGSNGKKKAPKATTSRQIYTLDVHLVDGPYTEESSEQEISRQIAIRGHQTLHDLHQAIFTAFERWEEHLYEFNLGTGPADRSQIYFYTGGWENEDEDSGDPETTTLDMLQLETGRRFGYTFDMGDQWQHVIEVVVITAGKATGTYPQVIKAVGEAPPQYPEDDEDWDDDDEC